MESSIDSLLPLYQRERSADRAMVLAIVRNTRGSTYRKAGAILLIAQNGDYAGLLTGGCLESDLLEHATEVIRTGRPGRVSYDLSTREDLIWGIGAGCEGAMDIELIRVGPQEQWQPFARLVAGHEAHRAERLEIGPDLSIELALPPRVLICGGGPDTLPIAALAQTLHWKLTILDHRPAYAQAGRFPASVSVKLIDLDTLGAGLDVAHFDAGVVLSHHLAFDLAYLRLLARSTLGYVGLLGPPMRRQRLLADLGADAPRLDGRLHAPVGLQIGGRAPESIALAIVAELHAYFHHKLDQLS